MPSGGAFKERSGGKNEGGATWRPLPCRQAPGASKTRLAGVKSTENWPPCPRGFPALTSHRDTRRPSRRPSRFGMTSCLFRPGRRVRELRAAEPNATILAGSSGTVNPRFGGFPRQSRANARPWPRPERYRPSLRAFAMSCERRSSSSGDSFDCGMPRSAATASSVEPSKNVWMRCASAERRARSRVTRGMKT